MGRRDGNSIRPKSRDRLGQLEQWVYDLEEALNAQADLLEGQQEAQEKMEGLIKNIASHGEKERAELHKTIQENRDSLNEMKGMLKAQGITVQTNITGTHGNVSATQNTSNGNKD